MTDMARRGAAGLAALLTLLLTPAVVLGGLVPVDEELERLSAAHGFTVIGIEKSESTLGRADREELYPRLRRLLENFDHVIVQDPEGVVERVIILGEKAPFVPPPTAPAEADEEQADAAPEEGDIVVPTEQSGSQHSVTVSLEGAGGKRIERVLLVDTGADYVVLPSTLVGDLALSPADLQQRDMQTANGKVTARVGSLPALWLGEHRLANVQVAFIEDGKLGAGGLLGMSVLGRYKMTIDDENGKLTLGKK